VLLPFRRENTLPEKNGTAARLPRLRYGGSVARDATVEAKSRPAAPRPEEKVRCSPPQRRCNQTAQGSLAFSFGFEP
jgi:hypothetical protein